MDTLIRRIYNDELNRLGDKCRALEAENAKLRNACKECRTLLLREHASRCELLNTLRPLLIDVEATK